MPEVEESPHVCPPYCHHCPDLKGMIMPGECWGCLDEAYDLSRCCCRPVDAAELKSIPTAVFGSFVQDVRRLQSQVCFLKNELQKLRKTPSKAKRRRAA